MYGEKALKKTAIYAVFKKVKNGKNSDDYFHLNSKKTVQTPALITSASAVTEDPCLIIEAVATAHGTFFSTIHAILHQE
jgi:hypothetical protein